MDLLFQLHVLPVRKAQLILQGLNRSLELLGFDIRVSPLLCKHSVVRLKLLNLRNEPLGSLLVSVELLVFFLDVLELLLQEQFFSARLVDIGLDPIKLPLILRARVGQMLILLA